MPIKFFEAFLNERLIEFKTLRINEVPMEGFFLFPEEKIQLESLNNEKRKKEFIGARILRNNLNINHSIAYKSIGKPYLVDASHRFISISHSTQIIAFGFAPFDIGIDVENIQERIHKVIDKFATEYEKNLYDQSGMSLTKWFSLLWCAKEAIYKLVGEKGLAFKEQISIQSVISKTNDIWSLDTYCSLKGGQVQSIEVFGFECENQLFALAKFKV